MKTFKQYTQSIDNLFNSMDNQLNPEKTSESSFIFGKDQEYEVYQINNKIFVKLDKKNKNVTQEIENFEDIISFIKKYK